MAFYFACAMFIYTVSVLTFGLKYLLVYVHLLLNIKRYLHFAKTELKQDTVFCYLYPRVKNTRIK